jgi:hypothetical protein
VFTDEQIDALFGRLFERMLLARWLREVRFTDGKGWRLVWTVKGTQRAFLLRQIVVAFRLTDDDRAPIAFDIFTQGKGSALFPHWEKNDDLARFWFHCVEDLHLHGDGDGLLALAHMVVQWAPGSDTPLKF